MTHKHNHGWKLQPWTMTMHELDPGWRGDAWDGSINGFRLGGRIIVYSWCKLWYMLRYFIVKSVIVMVAVTLFLLVLPLVLPPLPPPPLMLLLVPVMIFSLLIFLALSQPPLPNIAILCVWYKMYICFSYFQYDIENFSNMFNASGFF